MKINRRLFFGVICAASMSVTACSAPTEEPRNSADQKVVVHDDAGRTVVFDEPVDQVVVANRYNNELIRAMGHIDKVVAVDTNTA